MMADGIEAVPLCNFAGLTRFTRALRGPSIVLTTDDFRHDLSELLTAAQNLGFVAVEINAGNLHRRVGGYPGKDHRMPLCCEVMRKAMKNDDEVVDEPPSGQGARLTIRYRLSV